MAGATSRLDILINAKNDASSAIKQVGVDLKQLDSGAKSLAGGLGSIAGAAGVAGIVALGTAAATAAVDMAKGAAEAERMGVAFDNLAGQAGASGDEMLAAMQDAAHGTISNTELIASANRAMLLGVADSASEMASLLEVAGARGKAMGESTAQAFSDLVTGIGRMSPMILDNLGITVDAAKANEEYAKSIGKQADELTDAEAKQALLNAVLKDSTQIIADNKAAGDDAASNYERMDAALTNAKDSLGELFSPAIAAIAQSLADAVTGITETLDAMGPGGLEDLRVAAENADNAMAAATRDIQYAEQRLRELADANKIGNDEWMEANRLIHEAEARYKAAAGATLAYNQALLQAGDATTAAANAQKAADFAAMGLLNTLGAMPAVMADVADQALITGSAMINMGADARAAMEQFNIAMAESQGITKAIDSAAQAAGAFVAGKAGGDAGLARQQQMTDELTAQRKVWEDMGYTQEQINGVLLPGMVSQLNEAERASYKVATGTAKISDEAKAAEKAFSDLESKVSGVLSGALDPGVGVDPQEMLEAMGFPREDAINENARRLADIAANGLKGQDWLGEFQKEVPDIWQMIRLAQNPQEEAARLLQDFQDGLLTSPIDKEKAKEIVKRQILGDQNMAALATEIATELAAEMGIPMQEALAAAQGTLGGGKGMGSEAASTFSEDAVAAMEDEDGGGSFVSTFVDQARAKYSLLATAGTDAAKTWGDAFLAKVGDSVPPALVNLLTDLVTPEVVARMAQRGSLTGAVP